MTSEEKLAKIMARRALREIVQKYAGTMDFHEMMLLFEGQEPDGLSTGEAEVFRNLKGIIGRKDDSSLEADMKQLDSFKEHLSTQFDNLVSRVRIDLGG